MAGRAKTLKERISVGLHTPGDGFRSSMWTDRRGTRLRLSMRREQISKLEEVWVKIFWILEQMS